MTDPVAPKTRRRAPAIRGILRIARRDWMMSGGPWPAATPRPMRGSGTAAPPKEVGLPFRIIGGARRAESKRIRSCKIVVTC